MCNDLSRGAAVRLAYAGLSSLHSAPIIKHDQDRFACEIVYDSCNTPAIRSRVSTALWIVSRASAHSLTINSSSGSFSGGGQ